MVQTNSAEVVQQKVEPDFRRKHFFITAEGLFWGSNNGFVRILGKKLKIITPNNITDGNFVMQRAKELECKSVAHN